MMGWEYDGVQLNTGVSRALDQYEWRNAFAKSIEGGRQAFLARPMHSLADIH
jgi:thiazole synthase ThiGH ThiG subunit